MPIFCLGNVRLHRFLQKKSFWKVAELQMYAGRYHLAELWTRSTSQLRRPACSEANRLMCFLQQERRYSGDAEVSVCGRLWDS
jgi:hypothetical protein